LHPTGTECIQAMTIQESFQHCGKKLKCRVIVANKSRRKRKQQYRNSALNGIVIEKLMAQTHCFYGGRKLIRPSHPGKHLSFDLFFWTSPQAQQQKISQSVLRFRSQPTMLTPILPSRIAPGAGIVTGFTRTLSSAGP
jgi:hypothetical protein